MSRLNSSNAGPLLVVLSLLALGACDCSKSGDRDGGPGDDDGGRDGFVPFDSGVHDVCGDSDRGITEQCDDGNTTATDGCSPICEIESGFRCPVVGEPCLPIVCNDFPPKIEAPETCEDGNVVSNDGCSSTCMIESGWSCPIIGARCVAAECGDGIKVGLEQCDDGDATGGDGCSATCQIEPNFECPTQGANCTPTVCGNGTVNVTEQCDDGNTTPFDGCDAQCRKEPVCNAGVCTSTCGDGVAIPGQTPNEACEDGNTRPGDGCSATCAIEPGYSCAFMDLPDPASITIPAVYRDFIGYSDEFAENTTSQTGHIDFNNPDDSNGGIAFGIVGTTLGMVMGDDPPGPVNAVTRRVPRATGTNNYASGSNEGPPRDASFDDFYVVRNYSGAGDFQFNREVLGSLTLNRITTGPNTGSYEFDSAANGSPGFFPIDNQGFDVAGSTPREIHTNSDGGTHNFSFTTETHFTFRYTGTERLDFSGDDDLWVFVDGQLCLDVGGLHPAQTAIMDFGNINSEGNATQRGVVTACKAVLDARADIANGAGNNIPVYFDLAIFHAERHRGASNFKLTLKNFLQRRSVCNPVCGDGVVTPSEVCDNGTANNMGGYNQCNATCSGYGPYCGDGVTTAPEQCDQGDNTGGYNQCAPGCVQGPRCGDAIRQGSEQCDAGDQNGVSGSLCSTECFFVME